MPVTSSRADNNLAGCDDLQLALDSAQDGDVFTVTDPLCEDRSYDLPDGVELTLKGSDNGTVFDGGDTANDRILTGTNVGHSIFRNMSFRNGSENNESGGAVSLTGDVSAKFIDVSFFDNVAAQHGDEGGGLFIDSTTGPVVVKNSRFGGGPADAANPSKENEAGLGGGLGIHAENGIRLINNRFENNHGGYGAGAALWLDPSDPGGDLPQMVIVRGNRFVRNRSGPLVSGPQGGGLYIGVTGPGKQRVEVEDNLFKSNRGKGTRGGGMWLNGDLGGSALFKNNRFIKNRLTCVTIFSDCDISGGGLGMYGAFSWKLTERNNAFISNSIELPDGFDSTTGYGGGANLAAVPLVTSTNDVYKNNSITAPDGCGVVDAMFGGGMRTIATGTIGQNLAIAGSSNACGDGGGVYMNGDSASPDFMRLFDSTISGNSVAGGATGAGIFGDPTWEATVKLTNSIVAGNMGPGKDIASVPFLTVRYSDACNGPDLSSPQYPGAGNICANPRLADAAGGNVHETGPSPTIDAGRNGLVPNSLTKDFEGDARKRDGDGNGSVRVDMGADER